MQSNEHNGDALEHALSRLYQTAEPPEGFDARWRAAVRREEQIQMTMKPEKKRSPWRVAAPVLAALVLTIGSIWAGGRDFMPSVNSTNTPAGDMQRVSMKYSTANEADTQMADMDVPELGNGVMSGLIVEGETKASAADQDAGQQKLVRTASLTLRTRQYETDVERVKSLLAEYGGYVENLYEYGDIQSGDTRTVSLSLRVPSEQLDAFLNDLEAIARVVGRSESSTDMTVQYADNEARLNTLREKQTRLNELLKRAESVADIVEIENALNDTQYQIDSYETSQRSIDRRVGMSAVSVSVEEETNAESAAAEDISLGSRITAGFNASLRGLGAFFRNMLVFLVMALPVIAGVGIIALVIWLYVRRKRRTK